MRDRNVVAAPLEHHFHSGAGISVIVDDQKPVPARESFLLRFVLAIGAIFRVNRRRNGFQLHNKCCAFVFARAFHTNLSAVRIDHRFRNGKAETEPAEAPRNRRLSLFERIEDFSNLVLFNADAGVGDPNFNFIRLRVGSHDRDSPIVRRKLHAVLDQVPKDLLQTRRIAFHVYAVGLEIESRFD